MGNRALLLLALVALAAGQSVQNGTILEQAGQTERAFIEYLQVLGKTPADMVAYQGFARTAVAVGRFDSLAAVSRRLQKARPEQAEFALGLVDGLLRMKQSAPALAEARRAAATWPDRLPALAEKLAAGREFGAAADFYRQARERTGDRFAYADRLIDIYEQQGQPLAAVRELVALLNRNPNALGEYRQKLRAYVGKTGTGPLINELQKLAAPDARALAEATVWLAVGKEAEAVRVAKAALSPAALVLFAQECEAAGSLNAALAVYRDQNRHADAARVLGRLGRIPEARVELSQDQSAAGQLELGDLERRERNWDAARAAYGSVLRVQPGSEPALFGLANCLAVQGEFAAARAEARKAAQPTDRLLLLVERTFFLEGKSDSVQAAAAELARRFSQSFLVNDALELAVVAGAGDKTGELAQAMLDYEAGRDAVGLARAQALAKGKGPVAEQAHFVAAQFQRRLKKPKDALATLDELLQGPQAARARFEQARIYSEDYKDDGKSREALEQLILESPASVYVPVARNLLAQSGRPVEPGGIH